MKFLLVCVVGLLACVHAYVDESMVEKAKGNKVVEVSLKRLHKSCIFGDDKFFMRLLAFVESKDGNDAKTYRPDFYGGIWQLQEKKFNSSKGVSNKILNLVKKEFGINWRTVVWKDLLKPFYSALGARLYMQYLEDVFRVRVPSITISLYYYWKTNYNPNGGLSNFINGVNLVPNLCGFNADFAIMLENSYPFSQNSWSSVKEYLRNILPLLRLGSNYALHSKLSLWIFSENATLVKPFNQRFTARDIYALIDQLIASASSFRNVHLVLKDVADKGFLLSQGARGPKIPKYAILISNGHSSSPNQTQIEAERLRSKGVKVYTLGIFGGIDEAELNGIASKPPCTHNFVLVAYLSILNFLNQMRQDYCLQPTPIKNGLQTNLSQDSLQFLSLELGNNCTVLEISSTAGEAKVSFSVSSPHSSNRSKAEIKVTPKKPIFVFTSQTGGHLYVTVEATSNVSLTFNTRFVDCQCPGSMQKAPFYQNFNKCIPRPRNETFDCSTNNPCDPLRVANKYFYRHHDETKFVQCGVKTCNVMSCPATLVWDDSIQGCNFRP